MLNALASRNVLMSLACASAILSTTLMEDTFNRTSSDLNGDTPDLKQYGSNLWVGLSASFPITCATTGTGRAYAGNLTNDCNAYYDVGTDNHKIDVTGELRASATGNHRLRAYIRYLDYTHKWMALWDRNAATKLICYEVNGGATARITYAASVTGSHKVGLGAGSDNVIRLYFDDAAVGTYTSSTHDGNTKVGLAIDETQALADTWAELVTVTPA